LTDLATPAVADEILLSDTSDSNTVKKSDLDAILALYDSKTSTLTNKTFDANGTGNSLSNVGVADLANGTDGELITWAADATPTTVPAGTADQVLTSNGAGAAPTFQDAASTGASTALDNLTSVAINTSLISDTDSTDDLGSSSKFWSSTYSDNYVFPATQVASADANTLDDYEEGTWTPTFFDALSGGNEATYTAQQGFYTKIGNKVTVYFYLDIAGTAGMTAGNDGYIRGLPFTVKALTGSVEWAGSVHMYNITFNGTPILALHSNSAHLKVAELATGATHDFLIVSEYGTGYLTGSITYLI
jgi:hypothetical protein